jgi:DNA-binding IclR family transcriptional regulator
MWPGWPYPRSFALRVEIGTRFPAPVTSQGKVLLAALAPDRLDEVLAMPSRPASDRHRTRQILCVSPPDSVATRTRSRKNGRQAP